MQCLPRCISNLSRRPLYSSIVRPLRTSSACHSVPHSARRQLLTLAIETSCDDTCVAILEKDATGTARLHFNEKITSDNREFGGIHPLTAIVGHMTSLAPLVEKALRALPDADRDGSPENATGLSIDRRLRLKPDFVSVTRGPGMNTNLAVGLNTAKGLAVAWSVPLMAVNHMQAHALTPRLVRALERREAGQQDKIRGPESYSPQFPFVSLLASGGHTMLVHSRSLNDHKILAKAPNIAVGDMLDKCARLILPPEVLATEDSNAGMYAAMLEEFAFPGSKEGTSYNYNYTAPMRRGQEIAPLNLGYDWALTPPLSAMGTGAAAAAMYDFSGLNGQVQSIMAGRPEISIDERRSLAQGTMRLAFEHLANRVFLALPVIERDAVLGNDTTAPASDTTQEEPNNEKSNNNHAINTLVLSGGVASNQYLRHIMKATLDARGFPHIELVAPPISLCTDNAAMIAWAAMEMYEEGWRSDLGVQCLRRWSLDPAAEDGGILGAGGWHRVSSVAQ
ncbi:glycoprotease family-domain-containing protein [Xylaria sp. CBS 124048]|nr:glycoprotease family-domain-containing protein [Xylaria sp. CBS 124048]